MSPITLNDPDTSALVPSKNYLELFARSGEPEVHSLKAIGLSLIEKTDLLSLFQLNVRRQAAAFNLSANFP